MRKKAAARKQVAQKCQFCESKTDLVPMWGAAGRGRKPKIVGFICRPCLFKNP